MGTRTAVFQEQDNGEYIGIYVHYDGYIDGVGYILEEYYKDKSKIHELILNKQPLTGLGVENTIVNGNLDDPLINEKHECGWQRYTKTSEFAEKEYFMGGSLKSIQDFNYFTYNGNDEIEGVRSNSGLFVPYQGSDNNGYLYVQNRYGEWLVSYADDTGRMCDFEMLEPNLD